MNEAETRRQEVARNFQAFQQKLPELLASRRGQFAVMRHGAIVDYFDTIGAAVRFAAKTYEDQIFSIQEVTDKAVDLGWFSHAAAANPIQP
ncbi:MAG: hypothetical protein EXQ98_07055 [Alphaproteobacteria bacterium]|nr:hypothetical protein [Alphaproteobacteria bacterium]